MLQDASSLFVIRDGDGVMLPPTWCGGGGGEGGGGGASGCDVSGIALPSIMRGGKNRPLHSPTPMMRRRIEQARRLKRARELLPAPPPLTRRYAAQRVGNEQDQLRNLGERTTRRLVSNRDQLQQELLRRIGDSRPSLRRVFDAFDADGSGMLDTRELSKLMDRLHVPRVKDDRQMLAGELDTDGDGAVSFEEFEAWLLRADPNSSRNQDLKLLRMFHLAQHMRQRRRRERRRARKLAANVDFVAEARAKELREQREWRGGSKGGVPGKYKSR